MPSATVPPARALLDDVEDDQPLLRRLPHLLQGSPARRERAAEVVATRLDRPMAALGVVFLLVVLGQTLATSPALQRALTVAGWLLWAVFVGEYLLRLWIAPSRLRFLRRTWWQVVFLVIPVLRFLRLLVVLRVARAGAVVSSAIRSSRSASRLLTDRLGWLVTVTVIVVLAVSQLLFTFGIYAEYDDALHAAALATVAGQPFGREHALARVLDVALAAYSVVVFAALAGALGAYFLQEREEGQRAEDRQAGPDGAVTLSPRAPRPPRRARRGP